MFHQKELVMDREYFQKNKDLAIAIVKQVRLPVQGHIVKLVSLDIMEILIFIKL
jgi:hypothetical protein